MAVAYQNLAEAGTASASGITISAPDGFSAGDLFVVFITKDDDVLINEHEDWTTLHRVTSGGQMAVYCAWRIAEVGDTSWTWTGDSEAYYGAILRFTGHDTITPILISDVAVGDDAVPIAPDIETTRDGCMIFQAFGADDDDEPYTVPGSPFSQKFNDSYTTTGGAGGTWLQSSAGATGAGTFGMNAIEEWGAVTVAIQPVAVIPTVTTQACTDVEETTATGNGNITATGGQNCSRRGFCYMEGTEGDPTTSDSTAYDDGSFGTGAYTKGLTGLSPGTNYRVRAYAINSAGTGYGATVQLLTLTPPEGKVDSSEVASAIQYSTQRKLVRLSDGTLYATYLKQLSGLYQVYVKKSTNDGVTWIDAIRISTYAGMDSYSQKEASITVDSNNYLHVVWAGKATGYTGYNQIWYAKYTDSWSAPVRLSVLTGMEDYFQYYPSIAVDSNDYIHVVWDGLSSVHTSKHQIWYVKYTDSWTDPVRISTYSGMDLNSQWYASVAVDSSDYIHVVWHGYATDFSAYQIWYNKYTDSWAGPVRISTYAGMDTRSNSYASIATDSSDYIHVVWRGYATGYTLRYQIWYVKYISSWSTPVRISDYEGMEDYYQYYPSIVVDTSDHIHVLWYAKATGYSDYDKVWHTKYVSSWSTPECLQATGQNRYVNARWSRYPSSNIPYAGVDYVFMEGTASLYDIFWDKKDSPFPPEAPPVLGRSHGYIIY